MTRSVLAVGTHPGDIEFGCAGTLAAHRAAGDSVTMLVLTCDGPDTVPAAGRPRRPHAELDCLLVWGPQAAERRSGNRRGFPGPATTAGRRTSGPGRPGPG